MDHRRTHPQQTAAAKAGISERSARRIDRDPTLPSQRKKHPRGYRIRANPFEGNLGRRDGWSLHGLLAEGLSASGTPQPSLQFQLFVQTNGLST
jgi:hypothetical protein